MKAPKSDVSKPQKQASYFGVYMMLMSSFFPLLMCLLRSSVPYISSSAKLQTSRQNRMYDALEAAVKRGNLVEVKSVLSNDCNPNYTPTKKQPLSGIFSEDGLFQEYPLVTAVKRDDFAIAKALIARDALPDLQYSRPLTIAAEHGNIEMMRLMIWHGAIVNGSPDAKNSYALYAAVGAGKFNATRFLLRCGANPNSRGSEDESESDTKTALQLARKNGNVLVENLLLRAGAIK